MVNNYFNSENGFIYEFYTKKSNEIKFYNENKSAITNSILINSFFVEGIIKNLDILNIIDTKIRLEATMKEKGKLSNSLLEYNMIPSVAESETIKYNTLIDILEKDYNRRILETNKTIIKESIEDYEDYLKEGGFGALLFKKDKYFRLNSSSDIKKILNDKGVFEKDFYSILGRLFNYTLEDMHYEIKTIPILDLKKTEDLSLKEKIFKFKDSVFETIGLIDSHKSIYCYVKNLDLN